MTHAEAQATGAIERYLLEELDETESTSFEEHFFTCPECAEDVRLSTIFLGNLRAVLREPYAVAREVHHPTVIVGRRAWMLPASAAAVVLLAVSTGYQNLVQIPRLRQEVQMAKVIESPPTYDLVETRSDARNVVVAPASTRQVSLLLNNIPGKTFPYYECELRDRDNRVVRSFRLKVMTNLEQWQVPLEVNGLSSQGYALQIRGATGSSGPATEDVAEYHFRLEIQ